MIYAQKSEQKFYTIHIRFFSIFSPQKFIFSTSPAKFVSLFVIYSIIYLIYKMFAANLFSGREAFPSSRSVCLSGVLSAANQHAGDWRSPLSEAPLGSKSLSKGRLFFCFFTFHFSLFTFHFSLFTFSVAPCDMQKGQPSSRTKAVAPCCSYTII